MSNPKYPPHLAPSDHDNTARLTRIETRLVRLMEHFGLPSDALPIPSLTAVVPADDTRSVRIETRLVRLMAHLGLRADGSPVPLQPQTRRDSQPLSSRTNFSEW